MAQHVGAAGCQAGKYHLRRASTVIEHRLNGFLAKVCKRVGNRVNYYQTKPLGLFGVSPWVRKQQTHASELATGAAGRLVVAALLRASWA